MRKHLVAVITLLALALPAYAQNDIVVWSGGIGSEEREAAPASGTKLVFFVETGNFLANVQVVVKDASGKELVNETSKGPWMILNLAPGRYSVRATLGAQAQGGTIEVSGDSQEFAYMFKAQ